MSSTRLDALPEVSPKWGKAPVPLAIEAVPAPAPILALPRPALAVAAAGELLASLVLVGGGAVVTGLSTLT